MSEEIQKTVETAAEFGRVIQVVRVMHVIKGVLQVGDEKIISIGNSLKYDLGVDSLHHKLIIIEIEKEFNIEITTKEETGINTVQDLVNCVIAKLKNK